MLSGVSPAREFLRDHGGPVLLYGTIWLLRGQYVRVLSPKANNMLQWAMDSSKAALSLPIHVFCDIHKLSVKALPG